MRFSPRVLFLLTSLVLVSLSFAARAQMTASITVGTNDQILRRDAEGNSVSKRPGENFPEAINLDDCRRDVRIRVPITTTGFQDASLTLQAWAATSGIDCTDLTRRQGNTRQCYKVLPSDIPRAQSTIVDLRARDVIAQSQAKDENYVNATADICGKVDQAKFVVTFMWLKNNGTEVVSSVQYAVDADTIGPQPLSGVKVSVGDTRLTVSWDPLGTGEAGATNAQLVTIYYAPAQSRLVSTDASTSRVCIDAEPNDAGEIADASCSTTTTPGTTDTLTCTAPGFYEDGSPPDSTVPSIRTGAIGSQALLEGLTNGVSYAVAVAATDPYLNAGSITNPECATPELLDDFFEIYRKAGGQAGGGLCSLEAVGLPAQASVFLTGTGFAFAALMARRKRNRRIRETRNPQ